MVEFPVQKLVLLLALASAAHAAVDAQDRRDVSSPVDNQVRTESTALNTTQEALAVRSSDAAEDCNWIPVPGKTAGTMEPKGLTITSLAPLPEGEFLHYIRMKDFNHGHLAFCDIMSEMDSSGSAKLFIERSRLNDCSEEGRDGYIYIAYAVSYVSAKEACRSKPSEEHPFGFAIETHVKCLRIPKNGTSTVEATTWATFVRVCNTCPIIEGKVQPKIEAAAPNGVVGEEFKLQLAFDNLDLNDKVAFTTTIEKVELFAGGKSLEVPFTPAWIDDSTVEIIFILVKPASSPQTSVVVTAQHVWGFSRRLLGADRRSVKNETSMHSVLVFIDEDKKELSPIMDEPMPTITATSTPVPADGKETARGPSTIKHDTEAPKQEDELENSAISFEAVVIGAGVLAGGCVCAAAIVGRLLKPTSEAKEDAAPQDLQPSSAPTFQLTSTFAVDVDGTMCVSSQPRVAVIDGMLGHPPGAVQEAVMAGNA